MNREFKKGERLFSIIDGWGTVTDFKKMVMAPENDIYPARVFVRFDKYETESLISEDCFVLLQPWEYKLMPASQNQEEKQDQDNFKDDPDRHFLMYTSAELAERLIQYGVIEAEGGNSTSNIAVQISIGILEKVDKYLNSKRSGENN